MSGGHGTSRGVCRSESQAPCQAAFRNRPRFASHAKAASPKRAEPRRRAPALTALTASQAATRLSTRPPALHKFWLKPNSGFKTATLNSISGSRQPALLTSGPAVQSIADGRYKRACTMAVDDISQLLRAWSDGDQLALDELTPIVYAELRRLAHRYMRGERPDHGLQTTALVNEAYIRLVDYKRMQWQNRAHFFAVSAQLMRRILVEHARRHNLKRGRGVQHVSLDEAVARGRRSRRRPRGAR